MHRQNNAAVTMTGLVTLVTGSSKVVFTDDLASSAFHRILRFSIVACGGDIPVIVDGPTSTAPINPGALAASGSTPVDAQVGSSSQPAALLPSTQGKTGPGCHPDFTDADKLNARALEPAFESIATEYRIAPRFGWGKSTGLILHSLATSISLSLLLRSPWSSVHRSLCIWREFSLGQLSEFSQDGRAVLLSLRARRPTEVSEVCDTGPLSGHLLRLVLAASSSSPSVRTPSGAGVCGYGADFDEYILKPRLPCGCSAVEGN